MASVFQIPFVSLPPELSNRSLRTWDSLAHMMLCLALEDEFGVRFDECQITEMTDFDAIMRILEDIGVTG
jgi:acyl carrier protein